ncbi:MAG: ABC transporter substrate-binding protein [Nitrospirae bacterium]|nr:ABC transporter substrate-binding protein [Nitrospirota bacterium]
MHSQLYSKFKFITHIVVFIILTFCFIVTLFIPSCKSSNRIDGYVYYRLSANPSTLDPALIVDVTGGAISAKLFNGLVRLDESLRVVPDIAYKWEISQDGRSYIFYLKKDVLFSNRREVTAYDFKYSFERVLSPHTMSPNTWVLDRIDGTEDFINGNVGDVKGIRVEGRYRLKITLKEPFAPFLSLLCMTAAYVVPKEEIERLGVDFSVYPSGTGPFILKEWRHNQFLRLEARNDYFDGKPVIMGIMYRIIPEDLTVVAEFESGNLDVITVPASEFRRYKESPKWRDLISSAPGINTYYLGFNCDRAPFNNPLLRKAVSYAIDREKILKTIYEDRGILASGPIPHVLKTWDIPQRYSYNSQKAISLLKQAGYPNGVKIKIYLTSDQEVMDILEVIQGYLKNVGIDAELRQLEWSAYKEAINKGEPDAFWISWWADYPDPENFLFPLFHSSNLGPAGNRARFKDKEVDVLIEKGQRSMDKKMRDKYYHNAEELIVEYAPWVFFWHRTEYTIRQPWIKNYKIYPIYSIDKGMNQTVHPKGMEIGVNHTVHTIG